MHRSAWKNRLTLSLGVGIATVALIAGCSDDADDDDLGLDSTPTTAATETMTETAPTTAPTTAATETVTETPAVAEDAAVSIAADGLMLDGAMSDAMALAAGSTVTFTNDGAETITLTTDDGAIDEEIEAGDSFEFTFEDAGTWIVSVDGVEMGTITVS